MKRWGIIFAIIIAIGAMALVKLNGTSGFDTVDQVLTDHRMDIVQSVDFSKGSDSFTLKAEDKQQIKTLWKELRKTKIDYVGNKKEPNAYDYQIVIKMTDKKKLVMGVKDKQMLFAGEWYKISKNDVDRIADLYNQLQSTGK